MGNLACLNSTDWNQPLQHNVPESYAITEHVQQKQSKFQQLVMAAYLDMTKSSFVQKRAEHGFTLLTNKNGCIASNM